MKRGIPDIIRDAIEATDYPKILAWMEKYHAASATTAGVNQNKDVILMECVTGLSAFKEILSRYVNGEKLTIEDTQKINSYFREEVSFIPGTDENGNQVFLKQTITTPTTGNLDLSQLFQTFRDTLLSGVKFSICEECGKEYVKSRTDQRFHSKTCKNRVGQQRRRRLLRADNAGIV